MEQLRAQLANVKAAFERLTTRERHLVMAAAGAVVLFALFLIVYSFASSADGYRRRTATKLSKLAEVQALAASYRDAEEARKSVEERLNTNNIRLITYIEDNATRAGLEVPNMTPKGEQPLGDGNILESSVELTLTDVPLRKLVAFLQSVESGQLVKVKYLRLEPKVGGETVTAFTTVATYKLKQGS